MELQNHNPTNKRITILIVVASLAMIIGLVGLVIALMRPSPPPSSLKGLSQPDSSYEGANGTTFTIDGDFPVRGNSSNN